MKLIKKQVIKVLTLRQEDQKVSENGQVEFSLIKKNTLIPIGKINEIESSDFDYIEGSVSSDDRYDSKELRKFSKTLKGTSYIQCDHGEYYTELSFDELKDLINNVSA